jgi:hypothetical protein
MEHTSEADVDSWMQWIGLSGKPIRKALISIGTRPGQRGGLRALNRLIQGHHDFFGSRLIEAGEIDNLARAIGL